MGEQKTIYVKDSDVALWYRAQAYATKNRINMSALVMTALERLLAEEDPQD